MTFACSSRFFPNWPQWRASTECACRICSRPRCGPLSSRPSRRFLASRRTTTSRSSTPARPCCVGCALRLRDLFLELIQTIRDQCPAAGIRSNVIVGFPGETESDLAILESFLDAARLDVVGVFGYSDEDGTEAAAFGDKLPAEEIADRVERVNAMVDHLVAQRAEDRIGENVEIIVESVVEGSAEGRAAHQGPDVDGTTTVTGSAAPRGTWSQPASPTPSEPTCSPFRCDAQPYPDNVSIPAQNRTSPWNLANGLTVLRLLLVPLMGWLLLRDGGADETSRVGAFVVFSVAMITDRLDGELARRRGLVTDFGVIADPIADKALTGTAFIGLSVLGELPWWVTVVVLVREIGVTALRFALLRQAVLPAGRGGKVKTALQSLALGLYLLPLPAAWHPVEVVAMTLAVVVTIVTGVDYVAQARRITRAESTSTEPRADRPSDGDDRVIGPHRTRSP